MLPYPIALPSDSFESCLEVVPVATIPWKPEIHPHATVINKIGQIGKIGPAI